MRELTKSMTRFSWSMAVLGLQQMTQLARPKRALSSSSRAMDALSEAATGQLGAPLASLYEAGSDLQAGMVDTAVRLASGAWCNSCGAAPGSVREVIGRAGSVVRRGVSGGVRAFGRHDRQTANQKEVTDA